MSRPSLPSVLSCPVLSSKCGATVALNPVILSISVAIFYRLDEKEIDETLANSNQKSRPDRQLDHDLGPLRGLPQRTRGLVVA